MKRVLLPIATMVITWAAAAMVDAAPAAPGSSPEPFETIWATYGEARDELRRFDSGGQISQVEFSDDGRLLTFVRLDEPKAFDLTAGAFVEPVAEEDEDQIGDEPRRRGSRRGDRRWPGRGRQYAREPSPDGQWIAVCQDYNVVLESSDGETTLSVTVDGHRKFRYGTANWVYGEELFQNEAMWWSPDSQCLVFYEFDEREVPDFYLLNGWTDLRTELEQEGYSKAGEANPRVGLLAYSLQTGLITPLDTQGDSDEEWYLYRVRFTPNGDQVLFSRTNRRQNLLQIVAADPATGASRVVVEEIQETWQSNRPIMRFLDDGSRFIWETERTGSRQLELRHLDGRLLTPLTSGEDPIGAIARVDEARGVLFYTVFGPDHPLDVNLYRVNLDGADRRRLTHEPGSHSVQISPDGKWFITRYETISQPPSTALYDTEANFIAILAESEPARIAELGYPTPELFSFTADDGETTIYGSLYKPRDFDSARHYPLVVDVYGGPESRAVRNRYRPGDAACAFGVLHARIDNRGTTGRGKAFLGAVYQKLGIVDVRDQADGVRHLTQRPYIDAARVGIYGHSYGGYMSALAVMKFPDVFHAAVAGSALVDWRNYDTIYTERYMRTPQENPVGYDEGSCLSYVEQFRGELLLLHGMIDDNVHPNNAWQLVDALQRAGKPFQIMFYPEHGHGLSRHASRMQWEFLYSHLVPEHGQSAE
jgi:dipeptidyl-peptidase-4